MRQGYNKNTIENKKRRALPNERITALNATEGWKWEEEDPFQDNLDHWITQYRKKGNITPSYGAEDPEEKRAGSWQSHMRKYYKNTIENKKGTKLSNERIAALNATEGWEWDSDSFQDNLDHWITQYRKNGNKTPSKHAKDPDMKRAGIWQSTMRQGYNKNASWMTQERIAVLNATEGWKWSG
jgi:hypothetical protein